MIASHKTHHLPSYITAKDLFCGGGGGSLGFKLTMWLLFGTTSHGHVNWAINHWLKAVNSHNQNFPDTNHDCLDISKADPRRYNRTFILIAGPSCTDHTPAKGQKITGQNQLRLDLGSAFDTLHDNNAERTRVAMMDIPRFAAVHRYPIIICENVVEVKHWAGYARWEVEMRKLGYAGKEVYFNSMFAGVPQSRDRWYYAWVSKDIPMPNLDFRPRARCCACGIEHGITVGGHSLREHLEATNHAQAFAYLTDLIDKHTPISLDVILTLNRLVVDRLIDTPGQFRTGPVTIQGARMQPPHAAQVPKLMREWVRWIASQGQSYPTVLRAAIAHHGFEAVHPFRDGNGRTGRLLMNLILMQDGYPPALLLQEWRLAYLEALAVADTGRYGPIANLIGRAVEQGLDLYLEACEHRPAPEAEAEQLLADLAREFGYTTEYLGLLIRKGRLAGTKRGPRWYSTRAAIERYRREVQQGAIPRGRPRGRSRR